MENYWQWFLTLLWTIVAWIVCEGMGFQAAKKIYCIIVYFPLSLFAGMRGAFVSADTLNYVTKCYEVINKPIDGFLIQNWEVGYVVLNKIVFLFHENGHMVLFIVAVMTVFGFGLFFYKCSCNFYLSTFLFVALFVYFSAFVAVRQALAAMIICWAMASLWEGKRVRFIIFVFIASTMHMSALIFFPFVLLYPLSVRKIWLVIFLGIVFCFLVDKFGLLLFDNLLIEDTGKYYRYFGSRFDRETEYGLGLIRIAVLAALSAYCIYVSDNKYIRELKFDIKQSFFWNIILVVFFAMSSFLGYRVSILNRFSNYFLVYSCVLIPCVFNFVIYKYNLYRYRLIVSAFLLYIGLVYYIKSLSNVIGLGYLYEYYVFF